MRKPMRLFVLALVGLGLAGLVGCAKIPQNRYYTIESGLPATPSSTPLPIDVAVARFQTPQSLAQDRLVFRPGPHQVDYYNYSRWSGFPADLVTEAFLTRLRGAGLFHSVSRIQGAAKADYLLQGRIENLEEVDSDNAVSARVALTMEVRDTKTHAVVWSGRSSAEKPVSDRSVESIVRELNEGVRQCLDEITRGLTTHFRTAKTAGP